MYNDILDQIVWSFSSVNSFNVCPKNFYMRRIEKTSTKNNAFAQWGSFMHSLLEAYFKGEADFFDLPFMYMDDYENHITEKFPPNKYVDLSESYYDAGLNYLNNFEGLDSRYDVVSVEQKCLMDVGEYKFIGFIDLVLRDKSDGRLMIWDHKSKSKFTSKRELSEYLRQLYLYAAYVKEQYGEYPKTLSFNMFRAGQIIDTDFKLDDCNAAIDWFISSIDKIYSTTSFTDKITMAYYEKMKDIEDFKCDDFFCNNLCDTREHCPRSVAYNKKRPQRKRKSTA